MRRSPAPRPRHHLLLPVLSLALACLAHAAAAAPRPVGQEIEVLAAGTATTASLAVLPDGGFALAWVDPDGTLLLRHHSSTGEPEPAVEVAPAPVEPFFAPGIAADAAGRVVVAWTPPSTRGNGPVAVSARLFGADGSAAAPAFRVSDPQEHASRPRVATGADGRFAVAWDQRPAGEFDPLDPRLEDVFVATFRADGTPLSPVFRANTSVQDEQYLADLAFTPHGELIVVWDSWEGEGNLFDVIKRRFTVGGAPLEGEVLVNPDDDLRSTSQLDAALAVLPDGTSLVAWSSTARDPGFTTAVEAQRFDATGVKVGEPFVVNQVADGRQHLPSLAATENGYVVTWTDDCGFDECADGGDDGNDGDLAGVFGRALAADGTPLDGDFQVSATSRDIQTFVKVDAGRGAGPALLALWTQRPREPGDEPAPAFLVRHLEAPCTAGTHTLCLGEPAGGDGRFRVRATWRDFQGGSGRGRPVGRDGWGTFSFFRAGNVELATKVLDGRPVNGHFWVFYASLSNVSYRLEVVDTASGNRAVYDNPPRHFASRGDTTALPAAGPAAPGGSPPPDAGSTVAAGTVTAPTRLGPADRFEVEITWRDFFGNRGTATGLDLSTDTAWFWFFRPTNPEVVVKVLDGRPVNGHFWVFFGSLTNVAFEVTVRDTVTGQERRYENPLRSFASRGDTTAFPAGVPPGLAGVESLLFAGAHPDDEVIAAPLLGELCRTGTTCTLLVATRGEGGACRLPAGCGDLGALRSREMQAAATVLGAELEQWTLPDILPAGPAAVREQWAAAAGGDDRLLANLEAFLVRRAPGVVITFDPDHGSTGHPAHRALADLVLNAVARLGAAAPPVYLLETRLELREDGGAFTYRFFPADPDGEPLAMDATVPSAVLAEGRWQHLLRNAAAHPSQLDASRRDALGAVAPAQRRVWLRRIPEATGSGGSR